MVEGWQGDEYFILFAVEERLLATDRYKLHQFLPEHTLVGLRSWDDFIVCDREGTTFVVPTVPLKPADLVKCSLPDVASLEPDTRFTGKIKWYLKPLVFGGSVHDNENLAWVTLEQHSALVAWWNEKYKSLTAQSRTD